MAENIIQIKIEIKINLDVSAKMQENITYLKKIKYLQSNIGDSVISCDEIIEVAKIIPTKSISTKTIPSKDITTKTIPKKTTSTNTIAIHFSEKKATYKIKNFCISLAFLLITILLLITVSIYCCFLKHQSKQKHITTPVTN